MQASNVDYGVSKAGVLAFHEGLAQESKFRYQAPKVRTSFVSPSPYFPTLNFQKRVIHPGNILTPAFLPHSS
jgi:NAD(P)-dependent dehydrogenase (short-subunit alcohol dehydrogenase family)